MLQRMHMCITHSLYSICLTLAWLKMVRTERTLSHGEHSQTFRENAPLKNVFLWLDNHTDRINPLEEKIHNQNRPLLPSLSCYSSFSFLLFPPASSPPRPLFTPLSVHRMSHHPSLACCPTKHRCHFFIIIESETLKGEVKKKDFWAIKTWYLSIYAVMSTYFLH